ncbi:MAG: MBL fold metallo-hydrolase [Solirubrobacteraceae bacterium]|nr:MBL fold metallo-hydrolase [Solirubrobacteraceae bacterium]
MSKVHHLDAGTLRPTLGTSITPSGVLVCRVIVIELESGDLALIDTGIGADARLDPKRHLGAGAAAALGADRDPAGTVVAQLRALGLDPERVTDILITHLDMDHAAGLSDFPAATVRLHAKELKAALNPLPAERLRYFRANWEHGVHWSPFGAGTPDAELHGLPAFSEVLPGTGILAIPLPGHTRGHTGYAIPQGDGWLVHAGDTFYVAGQIADEDHGLPVGWGVAPFEFFAAAMPWKIRSTHRKLRALAKHDDITIVCSHDASLIEPRVAA